MIEMSVILIEILKNDMSLLDLLGSIPCDPRLSRNPLVGLSGSLLLTGGHLVVDRFLDVAPLVDTVQILQVLVEGTAAINLVIWNLLY